MSTTCKSCKGDLVEIEMHQDDLELTMHACNTCDTRSWSVDGKHQDLAGVLDSLSTPKVHLHAA